MEPRLKLTRERIENRLYIFVFSPLKFLADRGANLEDVDKEGTTPLMIACTLGRVENVKFIVEKLKSGNVAVSTKMGVGGVDRPQKNSWRPLHLSVVEGRTQVVRYLLEVGALGDTQLNTTYDKMTPLMLAAANGDLVSNIDCLDQWFPTFFISSPVSVFYIHFWPYMLDIT